MTPRHTLLLWLALFLAPCSLLHISAQEEKSVLKKETIRTARNADTLVVDTTSLLTISDNLMKGIRAHRDLSTFKPDPIRAMWLGLVLPGAGQRQEARERFFACFKESKKEETEEETEHSPSPCLHSFMVK